MKAIVPVLVMFLGFSSGIAQASAVGETLLCRTANNKFGGFTSIQVTPKGVHTFEISGFVSGGMAQFIRKISAVPADVTYAGDMVEYKNVDESLELDVISTVIDGKMVQTASFKEGSQFPALPMTCSLTVN